MIEITAKLSRTDSSTYAAGEIVECVIEFANKTTEGTDQPSTSEKSQTLAWASVQVHCYRKTSYTIKKKDKTSEITEMLGKTSLDAATKTLGDVIFESKPKILFCDLSLKPGETKEFIFSDTLPRNGPPTYRGHDIRYFYRVTIATQRLMSKVQTLSVPVRVLPIPVYQKTGDVPITEETTENITPTNPFLEKPEPTELEISWDHIKNLTARRAPKYYRISNKHGFVARFCLFKHCYKLGEDIIGSLDFTDRTVRCVQYSVKLQSIEIDLHNKEPEKSEANVYESIDSSSVKSIDLASVASGSVTDDMNNSSTTGSLNKNDEEEELTGKTSNFTFNHEVTYGIVQTYINIPIPMDITPSFRTELVELRWRLHFEFVTSTMLDFGAPDPVTGQLHVPETIPVETMVWDLPITLYAGNPLHMYLPSLPRTMTVK